MQIKTAELTGPALDWAVAKCEGNEITIRKGYLWIPTDCYSTDWTQGGPIIEREEISTEREYHTKDNWAAWTPAPIRDDSEAFGYGPTPLVAAMRCYVTSKFGNEVEIPCELEGE